MIYKISTKEWGWLTTSRNCGRTMACTETCGCDLMATILLNKELSFKDLAEITYQNHRQMFTNPFTGFSRYYKYSTCEISNKAEESKLIKSLCMWYFARKHLVWSGRVLMRGRGNGLREGKANEEIWRSKLRWNHCLQKENDGNL